MTQLSKTFSLSACALAVALLVTACGGGDASGPPDTVPPTVTITDSEASATATGPVTFTFTFSEDVGTSFTVEDIVVTGGTASGFSKTGNVATLVVTPPANSSGTLMVSVAAAKFSDIAGNANTAATTASQAFNTVVAAADSGNTGTCTAAPCIDFSGATVAFEAFEGLDSATVAADPADATNKVGKLVKVPSGQPWAGATLYTVAATKSVTPFDLSTNKVVTLRVYSAKAGTLMNLKVENSGDPTVSMEAHATTTQANKWETLSFDYTTPAAGSFNAAKTYDKVSIFPNFLVAETASTAYYFDELKYTAAGTVVVPPASCGTTEPTCAPTTVIPAGSITIYSEAAAAAGFDAFPNWGQATQFSEVTLAGNKSLKYSNLNYEGMQFTAVDVSGKGKVHLDLWSPDLTSVKISLISPGKENPVTQALTTKGWNSVDIDLSNYTVPDLTGIFQFKLEATTPGTLFVDNIYFWGTGTAVPPGPTPSPTAAAGSAGPVTIPVLAASMFGDFGASGDAVFAGDYAGAVDTNGNHAKWDSATTKGVANNGNIGYFQDSGLSTSAQKLEENGWVAGLIDNAAGVPSFFRYYILTKPAATFASSYIGLFANAPNNGTVDVSSRGSIKFRLWGPAEMYQDPAFSPTLEMKLTGPKISGCSTTGSGATEIKKTFVADQKIGAASTYKLSLAGWSVVGVCGTDTAGTAVASVLSKLAQVVVTVPGSSFNFTHQNVGGTQVTYTTGVNLGPIIFTTN